MLAQYNTLSIRTISQNGGNFHCCILNHVKGTRGEMNTRQTEGDMVQGNPQAIEGILYRLA